MMQSATPITEGYQQLQGWFDERARLAWDTIEMKPTRGIPTWLLHVMDIDVLENVSGHAPGSYLEDPDAVYMDFQRAIGTCMLDQYLARNPLSMSKKGYEAGTARKATTGAERIEQDGMLIDSPEAVVEHLERFVFPKLERQCAECDPNNAQAAQDLVRGEIDRQRQFGPSILKVPYGGGFQRFPYLRYGAYGYANYFMAYALYPEIMEKDFRLQADVAVKWNQVVARAYTEGGLPKLLRLDHDMADSRSTLVDIKSLDAIWFPQLERSLKPYLDAGIRLIWHCDGNLMDMVPRLLEVGFGGFQGFQYEDGMDYVAICRMKTRDGGPLLIKGGCSVTTTLPHGTVEDVKTQVKFLVANGPKVGLFLGASSSIAPGTNPANIKTLIECLQYYRDHGRG